MKELKPCPFCGSDMVEFVPDEKQLIKNTTTGFIWCYCCDFTSDSFYNKKIATRKWNRRADPKNKLLNKPLTLKQLQQMDGAPVWIENGMESKWCIVGSSEWFIYGFTDPEICGGKYGKTCFAYAHKPEGSD